jgi:hypothetical protein
VAAAHSAASAAARECGAGEDKGGAKNYDFQSIHVQYPFSPVIA